jgi:hypothetical protein
MPIPRVDDRYRRAVRCARTLACTIASGVSEDEGAGFPVPTDRVPVLRQR